MAPTPSQTVGPFFGFGLPFEGGSDAVPAAATGAIRIEGQVLDGSGEAVPDALLEVWAGDEFARSRTDAEGAFQFVIRKPVANLDAEGGMHAPHLEVTVFARGLLRHLVTRLYFPDEAAANENDPTLRLVDAERRGTLIARPGRGALRFDVRLQGEGETVFFAL